MTKNNSENKIQLGHGSGGVMTRDLLNSIVFRILDNPYLNSRHDGALIDTSGMMAISTDSFVVSPIFFKGGDIGSLAVHGTVNDVAMCGAIPQFISLAFIVEEGFPMEDFEKIVKSVKTAADNSGVQVITGDTKVVERGSADGVFVNTTGFGRVHPEALISLENVGSGDQIIVSGEVAQHGMAIMSQREGLEFESEIESDSTNLNFLVNDLLDAFGPQIKLLRDPTRGGLGSVLTEIASDMNLGIDLQESGIPVSKQVAAACEMLGLDPLHVANEGNFLAVVDNSIASEALDLMKNHPKGRNASMIGNITNDHKGQVILRSQIGGSRVVTPLIGEQLPRIC